MYTIVDCVSGILFTEHPEYGPQVWSLVKLRTRKGDRCAICGLRVGEQAYRPVTNRGNRMMRICIRH